MRMNVKDIIEEIITNFVCVIAMGVLTVLCAIVLWTADDYVCNFTGIGILLMGLVANVTILRDLVYDVKKFMEEEES